MNCDHIGDPKGLGDAIALRPPQRLSDLSGQLALVVKMDVESKSFGDLGDLLSDIS